MPNDEIAEVRKIRHEISEECVHDVRKVAAYYRRVEEELKKSGEFRFEGSSVEPHGASAGTCAGDGK
jgi:hypothetical protein